MPKKVLSRAQIAALSVAGVLLVFGLTIAMIQRSSDNEIKRNGIGTTAVSTGEYIQSRSGGRRSHVVYKARYAFTVGSTTRTVIGEKQYRSAEDIMPGKTVTIKYLKEEPHRAIVLSGE